MSRISSLADAMKRSVCTTFCKASARQIVIGSSHRALVRWSRRGCRYLMRSNEESCLKIFCSGILTLSYCRFWGYLLFDHFINNWRLNYCIIQTTFYITESSAFKNQVLYFRHDDWDTLCAPLIERLTSVTFEQLPDVSCPLFQLFSPPLKSSSLKLQRSCANAVSGFHSSDYCQKKQVCGQLSICAGRKLLPE